MDKGNEENRALSWQKRQLILALVLTAVLAVVLGTLAGDDTVIAIMRDNNSAAAFCGEIKNLLS